MAGLRAAMMIAVLMALVLVVGGHKHRHARDRHGHDEDHEGPQPCTDDPELFGVLPPCSTTSTTTTTTTTEESTTTQSLTALQRAHWCRFPNGTYLPLYYTYLSSACAMCQCSQGRNIRCSALQCMPTYCVDNSMPGRQSGQCCTTCSYERNANGCVYNNFTYPHGTIIKSVEGKMQCWCQLGNIECRNYMTSIFDSLDVFGSSSAVLIIMIILIIVLIFGFLLCCGCTIGCYYYFRQHQTAFQQAYDEYMNQPGWEPIEEPESDAAAKEKETEAEKSPFETPVVETVPPPYAVYDSSYATEQHK